MINIHINHDTRSLIDGPELNREVTAYQLYCPLHTPKNSLGTGIGPDL